MDAFFLRVEKMYIKLYEWALKKRHEGNTEHLYDLNPHRFSDDVPSQLGVMWSATLKVFYGIPILLIGLWVFYKITFSVRAFVLGSNGGTIRIVVI